MPQRGGEADPLSHATLAILLALAEGQQHGYAILKAVETQPEAPRLGAGTLYAALQRLMQDGFIEESQTKPSKSEDQRRRYYRITAAGRAAARGELLRLSRIVASAESRSLLGRAWFSNVPQLAEDR
jgi:DNA-binding PadR family transcriptional regulator